MGNRRKKCILVVVHLIEDTNVVNRELPIHMREIITPSVRLRLILHGLKRVKLVCLYHRTPTISAKDSK